MCSRNEDQKNVGTQGKAKKRMDFAVLYAENGVMFDYSDGIFKRIGFPVACQPQTSIRIKAKSHILGKE